MPFLQKQTLSSLSSHDLQSSALVSEPSNSPMLGVMKLGSPPTLRSSLLLLFLNQYQALASLPYQVPVFLLGQRVPMSVSRSLYLSSASSLVSWLQSNSMKSPVLMFFALGTCPQRSAAPYSLFKVLVFEFGTKYQESAFAAKE